MLVLDILDGTQDLSRYNHELIYGNGVVVGKDMEFEKILSQYIQIPDHDIFTLLSEGSEAKCTIIAWVFMDDAIEFDILGKWGGTDGNSEWRFATDGADKIFFSIGDGTGNYIGRLHNTALTPYRGRWIMLSVTYNASKLSSGIKIYLNTSQIDDTDNNIGTYGGAFNSARSIQVGANGGTGKYANGKMRNLLFDHNIEWSIKNIIEHYERTEKFY